MLKLLHGFGFSEQGVLATLGDTVFAYSSNPNCAEFYLFSSMAGIENRHNWIQITGRGPKEYQEIISRRYGQFNIDTMINESIPLNVAEFGPGLSHTLLAIGEKKVEAGEQMPLAIEKLSYEKVCRLASEIKTRFPLSKIILGKETASPEEVISTAEKYMSGHLVEILNSDIEDCRLPERFIHQTNLLLDICASMYSKNPEACHNKATQLLSSEGTYLIV